MTARNSALLVELITRLKANDDITERLGGSGGVIPVQVAAEKDDLDPRISVGVSTSSTERQNRLEDKTFEARVIVDGTRDYVDSNNVLGLIELLDAAADELTTHRNGWGAEGITSQEEVAWADEVNRYLGVVSATFERIDPAAPYQVAARTTGVSYGTDAAAYSFAYQK